MFGIAAIPGIDIFEIVLFMVEFTPYLIAVNVVLVMLVQPKYRVPTALALPLTWGLMILGVFTASWEDAERRGYDMSLPSVREALEDYIETGKGDVTDILESNKFAPTFVQVFVIIKTKVIAKVKIIKTLTTTAS